MKEIKSFLKKFKKITPPELSKKKLIIQVIKKYLDIDLQEKDIQVNGVIAYLNIPSVLKNEIKFSKEINEELSKYNIKILV